MTGLKKHPPKEGEPVTVATVDGESSGPHRKRVEIEVGRRLVEGRRRVKGRGGSRRRTEGGSMVLSSKGHKSRCASGKR